MSITERRFGFSLLVALSFAAAACLGACGLWGSRAAGEARGAHAAPREVRASDFTAPAAAGEALSRAATPEAEVGADSAPKPTTGWIDPTLARNGRDDVIVLMGAPGDMRPAAPAPESAAPSPGQTRAESGGDRGDAAEPPTTAAAGAVGGTGGVGGEVGVGQRMLVDQLVGQINGRPVFADEFFAAMNERLRLEASRMSERDWLAMTKKDIEGALWDKLRDDLLLGEFESSLTPEQKVGVVAFVESIRSDLISGNLGSEAQANVRLLEAEGVNLDAKVSDISRRRFILEQLRRAIGDRVQVSYRDVKLYYDQHLDDFVPVPVANFIIVRAPRSEGDKVARIEAALGAGEYFESVAARESTWKPGEGNRHQMPIKSRDYSAERFFGPDPLNNAALALTPGHASGRIDFGADAWWILLDSIEQPPGRSLYEAQTEIENLLRSARQREEEIRYFERLFLRGSFSDIKGMSVRLLTFAAERYLIQDRVKAREAMAALTHPTPPAPAPAAHPDPAPAPDR